MNSLLEEAERRVEFEDDEEEAEGVVAGEDDPSPAVRGFMRAQRFCHRLAPVFPMLLHMSSGIGTSSTVSNPSTFSKFGHTFLITFLHVPPYHKPPPWKTRNERSINRFKPRALPFFSRIAFTLS